MKISDGFLQQLQYLKHPIDVGNEALKRPHVLVIEMWATWCPPCRKNIPHLTKIQQHYHELEQRDPLRPPVLIVGVTDEPNTANLQRFVQDQGGQMDYHVACDSKNLVKSQLANPAQVRGIPHAFVIDGSSGEVVWHGHPMERALEDQIDQLVTKLKQTHKYSSSSAEQQRPLPLIKESSEELMQRPVRELKQILTERGISFVGLAEKADLVRKIVDACSSTVYYSSTQ